VFLKVVAAEGGSEVAELTGHDQAIIATALSPQGSLLATGSKDSAVTLWDTATWQSAGTLTGHASNINDLTFTPDGTRMVTASEDGTFKIWDVANRREIMTLQDAALSAEGQVVAPQEVRFSNDGHTLFTRTRPAVQPLLLRAFPWDEGTVPTGDATALSETVHAWKQTNEPVPPSP
jgi:WD40 repeat protein